jgi:hypothetical protein
MPRRCRVPFDRLKHSNGLCGRLLLPGRGAGLHRMPCWFPLPQRQCRAGSMFHRHLCRRWSHFLHDLPRGVRVHAHWHPHRMWSGHFFRSRRFLLRNLPFRPLLPGAYPGPRRVWHRHVRDCRRSHLHHSICRVLRGLHRSLRSNSVRPGLLRTRRIQRVHSRPCWVVRGVGGGNAQHVRPGPVLCRSRLLLLSMPGREVLRRPGVRSSRLPCRNLRHLSRPAGHVPGVHCWLRVRRRLVCAHGLHLWSVCER